MAITPVVAAGCAAFAAHDRADIVLEANGMVGHALWSYSFQGLMDTTT